MVRIGGIRRSHDGSWRYAIPTGNTYRCKKCHKIWVEHIWVGEGWRGHVERMHARKMGLNESHVYRDCSQTNCVINHQNECDGELILIKEGKDVQTEKLRKINDNARKIVDNLFKEKKEKKDDRRTRLERNSN